MPTQWRRATIRSYGLAGSECNAEFVSGEWPGADGYRPALSASVDSIAAIRVIVEPESGKQYFVPDQQHLVTRIPAVNGWDWSSKYEPEAKAFEWPSDYTVTDAAP